MVLAEELRPITRRISGSKEYRVSTVKKTGSNPYANEEEAEHQMFSYSAERLCEFLVACYANGLRRGACRLYVVGQAFVENQGFCFQISRQS